MAFNSSVGRLMQLLLDPDGGLVIQSKTPVTENALGGCEQTITFLVADARYPAIVPPKFAASPLHAQLRKDTSRYTKGGHSPGVGKLEVTYRGSFYTAPAPDALFPGALEPDGHIGHMEITDSYSAVQIRTILGETYTYRALNRQYHYLLDYIYVLGLVDSPLVNGRLNAPLYATAASWQQWDTTRSLHRTYTNDPPKPVIDGAVETVPFSRVKDAVTYNYNAVWTVGDLRIQEYGALFDVTEVGTVRVVETIEP